MHRLILRTAPALIFWASSIGAQTTNPCPANARFYTDYQETILIPGPDHRMHPERSVWLRMEEAIRAAREGRYGLRLLSEEVV